MLEKITIRIDKKDWKKFKEISHKNGFSASSLIRNFIKEYIIKEEKKIKT